MAFTFDAKQKVLIDAIAALGGGWHTRQAIAEHLGKKRLNPGEVAVLDLLVDLDRLDRRQEPSTLPHIMQWAYSLKEGDQR